jgi:hypothetical protein
MDRAAKRVCSMRTCCCSIAKRPLPIHRGDGAETTGRAGVLPAPSASSGAYARRRRASTFLRRVEATGGFIPFTIIYTTSELHNGCRTTTSLSTAHLPCPIRRGLLRARGRRTPQPALPRPAHGPLQLRVDGLLRARAHAAQARARREQHPEREAGPVHALAVRRAGPVRRRRALRRRSHRHRPARDVRVLLGRVPRRAHQRREDVRE